MTIASEISRLQTAKADIKTAIEGKGVTVPSSAKLDTYDDYIEQIEQSSYDGPYTEKIKNYYDYIRGPSPLGYHVPLKEERQGIKTIMFNLNLKSGIAWETNLHLPFAGYRSSSNGNVNSQGSMFSYRCSDCFDNTSNGNNLYGRNSDTIYVVINNYERAQGYSIRCFKDQYVIPTSSWTVIQGTLGNAGIFWDQSQGLISITDGSAGYTIMDKNLGATTVYNSGDTLSEANCGKYYQWGNNYGFAWTGNINTSTTKVDGSLYGPETNSYYYSGINFIIGYDNWDNSNNRNLRGALSYSDKGNISQEYVLINGDKYTEKHLLDFNDLITLNAKTHQLYYELNKYPGSYFDNLNASGHIGKATVSSQEKDFFILASDGTVQSWRTSRGGVATYFENGRRNMIG